MRRLTSISILVFCVASSAVGEDLFTSKVEPLLERHCFECHSHAKKIKGGLALDSRSGWERGGDGGPAVVPGKPAESLLIKAVSHLDKDLQMPPKKMLPPSEIELLKEWIKEGAPDPRAGSVAPASGKPADAEWEEAFQKRLDWWSLKPLCRVEPPPEKDTHGLREPVDRFVRTTLAVAGLAPAAPAQPEVLLRRLSFVLTGLPPAPEQRANFLAHWERDPGVAWATLVEELLASAHFGEHFARHWMDVVRYTDTYGYEWDNPAKGSHEYRDYLVRAFNADIGFDQLVREQLAGDLLPQPRINREFAINESLIGPMFFHLGEHRHGSSLGFFNGVHQEMVNNKIDAFSKTFLATTVACARCHDHKLEAVSQRDYYALGAVFMTPRWTAREVDAPKKNAAAIEKLRQLRGEIRREMAAQWLAAAQTKAAWAPQAFGALVAGRRESPAKTDQPSVPKLDEVGYPIVRLLEWKGEVAQLWEELGREWREARAARLKANAEFTTLADFAQPSFPEGWVAEGEGMQQGFVEDGTPLIALDGAAVVSQLLRRGYHTHALSSKLPGALRMPPQSAVPGRFASVQLAGGEFSSHLVVPGNAFLNEPITFLSTPTVVWKSFADEKLNNGVPNVTVEFTTASLNPNFPPRTGLAKGLQNSDFGYDKRSWLSITGIVGHDKTGAPQDTLEHYAPLYEGLPKSSDEAWQRIGDWLAGAVVRWSEGGPRPGDVLVVDWLLSKKLLPNEAAEGSPLARRLTEYRRVELGIEHPRTVNTMDERGRERMAYPLNVRGNVDVQGELVSPDFLRMFAGKHTVAESRGSGRLELAESLLNAEHPLTSRVYVNRVWQWIFGTGLVATPDDFGRLGDKPSHPELLDWLAREFMREGWSTKKLVRRLVRSETFRQSGTVSEAARTRDPANRLLHHYPTRRLEAEGIRDSLLAVSGRLDPQLYGRPILPVRRVEDGAKRLFSGPLDGHGRRSLYLQMSIMAPPAFLAGFNLPDLKLPTGRRDVTNVPGQALTMLNDPFVAAMARHWAGRLQQTRQTTPEERVEAMFVQAFARNPDEKELRLWTVAARSLASPEGGELLENEGAWTQLGHAFFNTTEFLFYR
jgi:hypothetical protein